MGMLPSTYIHVVTCLSYVYALPSLQFSAGVQYFRPDNGGLVSMALCCGSKGCKIETRPLRLHFDRGEMFWPVYSAVLVLVKEPHVETSGTLHQGISVGFGM